MGAKLEKFAKARETDGSPENRSTTNSTIKGELDYDEVDTEKPTTSEYNGPVSYDEEHQDTTARAVEEENQLKSIMKTREHAKRQHAVRFSERLDVSEEPEEWKPTYLERWRMFCSKPVCKAIKAVVFCIVLPCSLIYVAIFFLSKQTVKLKPVHESEPFT